MAIPDFVKIKNGHLPTAPGVYFMKDAAGKLMYVGKATSLRTRVGSYFARPQELRIASMVAKIRRIDYEETPTAIEALMLESRLIKKLQPPYNVMEKDDKSLIHLAFTREDFPRPVLVRAHDLEREGEGKYLKTFGPFGNAASVRAALDALRPAFPWTTCRPGAKRPCFYRHLKLCPGVCTGEISAVSYRRIIRGLLAFFTGDRIKVTAALTREMKKAAREQRFEDAATLRNRLAALADLRDINVMKREEAAERQASAPLAPRRIEGYDISNISGTSPVGSMVVFEDGEPRKGEYRVFHVKSPGPDDYAMMKEVLRRRFRRLVEDRKGKPVRRNPDAGGPARRSFSEGGPDLLLIDGGAGQVAVARAVLAEANLVIPVVGLAKGPDRKQDVPVFDRATPGLAAFVARNKRLLQQVRDEAHRFAVAKHRQRRGKTFLAESRKSRA